MKIILVDDEKFAIEGLKNMLDWESFEGELIGTATNGKSALDLIKTNQPDVVISDIKMPIMDGLDLAKAIHASTWDIEVILLSAHGEFEYARQAIEHKVTNYILKPITREKINNLQSLLIDLNQYRKTTKQEFLQLWDDQFKANILTGLRHNNQDVFDKLFSSILFTSDISNECYNTIGIQLINFLYEYLSEINVPSQLLANSRQKSMHEYWDLPNQQEKSNYLITKYYDVLSSVNEQKHAHTDSLILSANQYINGHFHEINFNISYLANELNVSLSYLSTLFKQAMGVNLSTYIISLRLNKAKELLSCIKYSIADISLQCGYEDSRYFAKLFKKKIGITPSEYRNIHIQNHSTTS